MRAFRIGWRGFDSRRGKRRRRCTGSAAGTPELVDRLDVDRGLLAAAIVLEFIGHALILAKRREPRQDRSEEHTSELQSLMRISYAVFCLKKKKRHNCTLAHQPTSQVLHHLHNNHTYVKVTHSCTLLFITIFVQT